MENATTNATTNAPTSSSRSGSPRWVLPLLVALILLAILRLPALTSGDGPSSPAVGKPAPQIDLVVLDEQPRLECLREVPAGSVTLLHFWGTWCGPCRMEFPELATMAARQSEASRFLFLSVSCEAHGGETFDGLLEKTRRYVESEGLLVRSYADPRGITRRSVAQRLGANTMAYPTSVLIDADGRIAGVWEGYTPSSVGQMESLINRLLEQAGSSRASS